MKYVQPWGISDPDASYINGDASIARQGSIPPAAAFEHPMRELVAVITKSNFIPDSSDLTQVAKSIRSQFMNYCVDTGSVNTLSVALDPPIGAYSFGLPLHVKVANTNTGPVTIDAGAGRVPVRKPNGTDLAAGDLPAYAIAALVYDGTVFQMINFGGTGGGPITINQTIPYCVDSSAVRNQVVANFTPAITTLVAGTIFMVKIANTSNASSATINVNGLGAKPVFAQGSNANWPLLPGDMQAGDVLIFVYDGTRFWIYANPAVNESVSLNASTVAQVRDLFSALGRKRISTSGMVSIILAAGLYKPPYDSNNSIITTYHPDAQRIMLQGTMNAGQVAPPNAGVFQRSGSSAAARANDAAYNLQMLRARYATEFQLDSTAAAAISSIGPGQIQVSNILVTGPNFAVTGQVGFAARGGSMACYGCSSWGPGDVGFAAYGPAHMYCGNCHSCAASSRGFIATGNAELTFAGGSSEGNANHGIEISHGARCISDFAEGLSLSVGMQSSCNGGCGLSAQSGFAMVWWATLVANGAIDMYAFNMGTIAEKHSSIGTVSPAWGAEGNLNSIAINYD